MNTHEESVYETLYHMIDLVASGQYHEVAKITQGVRLSSEDMKNAVTDYGEDLIPIPPCELASAIIIKIAGSNPAAWSVTCPLWSEREGRSDLTLELTMISKETGGFIVEIDNIHVL